MYTCTIHAFEITRWKGNNKGEADKEKTVGKRALKHPLKIMVVLIMLSTCDIDYRLSMDAGRE